MQRRNVVARRLACVLAAMAMTCALWAAGVAVASPVDQSVAYQLNPGHTGQMATAGLSAPLTQQWSITLPGPSSYPVIVNGRVYVTAGDKTLYAINQATGATAWSRTVGGTYPVPSVAYDRGMIYTLNYDGLLSAVDPASGSLRWSKQIPGSGFEGPVTAHDGMLYASGNGQLVALRGTDGRLQWSAPVLNGDWSSPAVNGDLVHVSYACQQVYGFDRLTGATAWHASGPCSGGGGRTAVAAGGRVYAREGALGGNNIYDAATGATLGPFNAGPAPAVAGGVMYAVDETALRAVSDAGLGANRWTFPGDGQLQSAPLAVGGLVFVGSATGMLYAVNAASGVSAWSTNIGAAIPYPDEHNVSQPLTGLGAANGTLVVPAGNKLFAYRSAGAIAGPPSNAAAPTIDGAARQGQLLAADVGIWSGQPSSYGYEWQRCDAAGASCGALPGATAPTYMAVAGDVGATLRVRVTATNAHGTSAPVASQQSGVVTVAAPANQSQPAISGLAAQGQTLTALPGTWSGGPTSYAYQWQRCTLPPFASCEDVQGANAATYVVAAADVNSQLQVRVVATNAGGDSDPATSAPSARVGPPAPENQVAPSFTGQLRVGEQLIAEPGTWSGNPSSYTYQWFSCDATDKCSDIAGATQQTYVIGAAQLGRFIGVEVIATNASGGSSQPEATDAFGPVTKAIPRIVSDPTVGGTPHQGQTLTATTGVWSGDPTSFSMQWYSCDEAVTECGAIPGAIASTYVLTPGDVGRLVGVGVVATNDGGESDEEFSDLTAPVRGTPATSPSPPPPPPPPPVPQKTAPDSSFAIVTTKARTDGAIELSVRPHDAGTLTAHATASAAVLARGCTSPCSRSGRARFGRASTTAKVGGQVVKLKITPTARARRALAKARSIRVRVTIQFRSRLGGQPQTNVRSLTVKGTRRRSSRVRRLHENAAARSAFALLAPL